MVFLQFCVHRASTFTAHCSFLILLFGFQGSISEKRVTELTLQEFLCYGPQRDAGNVHLFKFMLVCSLQKEMEAHSSCFTSVGGKINVQES